MNPFLSMLNDTVYIENTNGERSKAYKTAIGSKGGLSATIFDKSIDVEEGWKLIRDLPNGKEETYTITETNYSPGLHSIPASWKLKLRKDNSLISNKAPIQKNTTININNSSGIQVGDNNTQNIEVGIKDLIEQINASDVDDTDKKQAKSILKQLIDNQVVAGVLGGAASSLVGLLG